MTSYRIKFFFFSEKIILKNSDLNLDGLRKDLDSKSSSMDRRISLDSGSDILPNDPSILLIRKIMQQYYQFVNAYNTFITRF